MGDVAMVIPVAYALARTYPKHEFTLLTQPHLTGLLVEPPPNLEAMVIDIRHEERRIWGLLRYLSRLRRERFDGFVDLHDVLRTRVLRWGLRLWGVPTKHLRKPRRERKRLLSLGRGQVTVPPMHNLYAETLERAGLRLSEPIVPIAVPHAGGIVRRLWGDLPAKPVVGIAPFASTESKTYDLSLMEQCLDQLSRRGDCDICLLGGRGTEAETLGKWADRYPHTRTFAGTLELYEELALISHMACVVSMDSANAHFASLVGTPTITLWCATDPSAGFLAMGQSLEDCLGDESLPCRPCTIFGKLDKCKLGDMPCRRGIAPERIIEHVDHHLAHHHTRPTNEA